MTTNNELQPWSNTLRRAIRTFVHEILPDNVRLNRDSIIVEAVYTLVTREFAYADRLDRTAALEEAERIKAEKEKMTSVICSGFRICPFTQCGFHSPTSVPTAWALRAQLCGKYCLGMVNGTVSLVSPDSTGWTPTEE